MSNGSRTRAAPTPPIRVAQLWIYPVKSMGGTPLTTAVLSDRGLVDDRRWMLVDPDGRFMTQRKHPRMALVSASAHASALVLQAPGMPRLSLVRAVASQPSRRVQVWDSICEAQSMGRDASVWLESFLQAPCELVYMPDTTRRPVSPKRAKPGDIVSFADGYPILVTNEASLRELNARLDTPVPMDRFRANVVVTGAQAWEEDAWLGVTVGNVDMRVAKPCGRCVIINVDQRTAKSGKEPLRTLASFRRLGKSVVFGQNLIHNAGGTLHVGDALYPRCA